MNEWKLTRDKMGIQIYLRDYPGKLLKEFKATTLIDSNYKIIADHVMNPKSWYDWFPNVKKGSARILVDHGKTHISTFTFKAPWPIKNRDVVHHHTIERDKKNKNIKVTLKALPDFIPKQKNTVRVDFSNTIWTFIHREKNLTFIEFQSISSPRGNIPDRLMQLGVVETPFYSLKKLKKYFGK